MGKRALGIISLTLCAAVTLTMGAVTPQSATFTDYVPAAAGPFGSRQCDDFFGTTNYDDSPALGGIRADEIHAINDAGTVVGEYVIGGVTRGFRDAAEMGTMPGVSNGAYINYVRNINSSGTMVGQYTVTGGASSWRPFVASGAWGTGTPTFLFDGITDNARPSDINDAGYIVGQIFVGGGYKAALWDPASQTTTATYISLPTGANDNSRAGAINSAMNIAGNANGKADALPSNYVSTVWVTGAASTSAVAIPAPASVEAGATVYYSMDDMNENGTVVGSAGRQWDPVVPFIWTPTVANGTTGTSTAMATYKSGATTYDVDPDGGENVRVGRPTAINDAGVAVGWLSEGNSNGSNSIVETNSSFGYWKDSWIPESCEAFIWDTSDGNTEALRLEDLLPQADQDTLHLLWATDINNVASDACKVTVGYKLESDITANGFNNAKIYGGILDISFAGGPALIPGDCDGDGDVDLTDLAILASNYGAVEPPALEHGDGDFDDDGDVDLTDLAILANNWGFGTMTAVPEPATMSLIALGGVAMIRRRR